ncbi:hypothetical protein SynRS9902_00781 [Synechococcus sp. RS9902]|nr:hypothetical protein SynRS9902_00781 [Synechococcus sp. RS9902]
MDEQFNYPHEVHIHGDVHIRYYKENPTHEHKKVYVERKENQVHVHRENMYTTQLKTQKVLTRD